MDAIIGRYRAGMEKSGLVLRHPAGIKFDLTPEETLSLSDFINVYKQTLMIMEQELETEPQLERVILVKEDNQDE